VRQRSIADDEPQNAAGPWRHDRRPGLFEVVAGTLVERGEPLGAPDAGPLAEDDPLGVDPIEEAVELGVDPAVFGEEGDLGLVSFDRFELSVDVLVMSTNVVGSNAEVGFPK